MCVVSVGSENRKRIIYYVGVTWHHTRKTNISKKHYTCNDSSNNLFSFIHAL